MKMIPIITAIIIFTFTSCNQKPIDIAPVIQEETVVDANNESDNNPLCDGVKDIAAALPKFDNYRGYKLDETICLPNRAYGFNYEGKDNTSQKFTIIIYDTRTDYKDMYTHFISGYKEAQESKAPNIMRTSKLPGNKGYVVAFNDAETIGGSYDCLIKDNYYLHVLINDDKTASSPDGLEAFIGDYIAKINVAKLK